MPELDSTAKKKDTDTKMTLGRVSRPLYEYYVLSVIQLSLQNMEKVYQTHS